MSPAVPDPVPPLRWRLAHAQVACSTAVDGDLRDPLRRSAWLRKEGIALPCVVPRQVHGTLVIDATAPSELHERADGVVSADPQLALGAYGADCPALCLMSDDALGIAHCGWRGTAAGIVPRLVAAFARCSRRPPASWQAFIGPGISAGCYEVDGPVLAARRWPEGCLRPTSDGHAQLDLTAAIVADLLACGGPLAASSGVCTASDPRLWSYRRRGPGQVQLLAVWR
jgi:YfiH family protein